jgi:hypothetical protein
VSEGTGINEMMSKDEAIKIAENFVATQDLRGFTYKCAGTSTNSRSLEHRGVIFDVYTSDGSYVDGPVVVIIEKGTSTAKFL